MTKRFAAVDANGIVKAFYSSDIHGDDQIPSDAIEIDDARYSALLAGQQNGKRMSLSPDGVPALLEPLPISNEKLDSIARSHRHHALHSTDWLISRHMDETISGGSHSLTVKQCKALIDYRQALRDLPAAKGFPNIALPVAPDFIGVK